MAARPRLVRAAARAAAAGPGRAVPYRTGPDVRLDVELNDGAYLRAVRAQFRACMSDAHTLTLTGASATAVWAQYWQMKRRAQAAVA